MIKCPNCNSTAQVEFCEDYNNRFRITEKAYQCGCGCQFTVTFQAIETKIDYIENKT